MKLSPCLALFALLAAACSTDTATVTAVTYNGGLALGFVPGALERRPFVADAIAGLDADVVCAQEIWVADDVAAVKSASAATFPNTIFLDPTGPGQMGTAACTAMDLQPIYDCATAAGCDAVCGDELVGCVLGNCGMEYMALNTGAPSCSLCLQANIGNALDDIRTTCTSSSTEYTFGGSFGIGLLTKRAIVAQDQLILDSTTTRRAIIYAQLDTDVGPVHTFCTHLTAVFDEMEIPYPKPTGSWKEEQAAQIGVMLSWVAEKAGSGAVMVMGDMNNGPAGAGYIADNDDHFATLSAGFSVPYVEGGGPCTFCMENPLVGTDHAGDVLIDHVLIKGFSEPTSDIQRVFDQPITHPICGVDTASRISDHYGVRVSVDAEPAGGEPPPPG